MTRWLTTACLAVIASSAHASPIIYDITFQSGAAQPEPLGTGMFIWHDDTQTISNFMWNFDGRVGGFFDSFWTQGDPSDAGPSLSVLVFEFMTKEDVDPDWDCNDTAGCRMGATNGQFAFGWPFYPDGGYINEITGFGMNTTFTFVTPAEPIGGTYTTTQSVPEPATLALMLAGLAGTALARRRRRSMAQ